MITQTILLAIILAGLSFQFGMEAGVKKATNKLRGEHYSKDTADKAERIKIWKRKSK